MKGSDKVILVVIAVILATTYSNFAAFAGDGGINTGGGAPPYGLKIEGAYAGQKLTGELYTEDWNWYHLSGFSDYAAVLRMATRLRSGNVLQTYFTDLSCGDQLPGASCTLGRVEDEPGCLLKRICVPKGGPQNCPDSRGCYDVLDIPNIQVAIMTWLKNDPAFCEFIASYNLTCQQNIALKSFVEYGHVLTTDPNGVPSSVHLSDIEIAVK